MAGDSRLWRLVANDANDGRWLRPLVVGGRWGYRRQSAVVGGGQWQQLVADGSGRGQMVAADGSGR